MSAPKRILFVDDDRRLQQVMRRYLCPPEFALHAFEDPLAALARLGEIEPDLVLCDVRLPGVDGWAFLRAARSVPRMSRVPFVFLSGYPPDERQLLDLAEGDVFLMKPLSLPRLVERIRLAVGQGSSARETGEELRLMGSVARRDLPALLKHCEETRLTGRLRLDSASDSLWLDFLNGDLVGGGGTPSAGDGEALDAVLALEDATFRIEARSAPDEGEESGEQAQHPAPPLPIGRFSIVDTPAGTVQIHSEAEHTPNFLVRTVVARAGQGLRKIESTWPHPLKRDADHALAKQEIEEQHERVLALVREGGAEISPRRKVWAFEGKGVAGPLLSWTASFVAARVQEKLGRVATNALLRRVLRRLASAHPTLAYFRVAEDGHVVLEEPTLSARTTISGRRLPPGAIEAVAAWLVAFLADVAAYSPEAGALSVRDCTRMMQTELAGLGFYQALDAAAAARESPPALSFTGNPSSS